MNSSPADITLLLNRLAGGDQEAASRLAPLIYDELRRVAMRHLRGERRDHTLQATALVHEAYLKLAGQRKAHWQNRTQFFAVASHVMRRILVDYARSRCRLRRGGQQSKISLDEVVLVSEDRTEEVLALNDLLTKLEKMDARQARIVELRYFGGLTLEEAAAALDLSSRTVMREWCLAKAWLYGSLERSHGDCSKRLGTN